MTQNKISKKNTGREQLKKKENLGKEELAATPYHRINSFLKLFILWAQSSMPKGPKNKKWPKK